MHSHSIRLALVTVAISLTATSVLAQKSGFDTEEIRNFQQKPIYRVVRDGCSPVAINDAITEITFGRLATWLEANRQDNEANRIRLIQTEQKRRFADATEQTATYLAVSINNTGKGTAWDPEALMPTALQLLGGEEAMTRYVAASRKALLEAYKAPAAFFYRQKTVDPNHWVSISGSTSPDMVQVSGMTQLYPLRASFELPLTVYRYLLEGKGYGQTPIAGGPETPMYVNAAAKAYADQVRQTAARDIQAASDVPLRDTLAKYISGGPDAQVEINDTSDQALAFASWIPNLCLTYQTAMTPTFFGQEVIEKLYIGDLKARKEW